VPSVVLYGTEDTYSEVSKYFGIEPLEEVNWCSEGLGTRVQTITYVV